MPEPKHATRKWKDPKKEKVTPLFTPSSVVLTDGEKGHLIHPPRFTHDYIDPDMDLYCQYHRARDHDAKICHYLQNKIEYLIREGHLQEYVRKTSR